jgi:hypothetical protein
MSHMSLAHLIRHYNTLIGLDYVSCFPLANCVTTYISFLDSAKFYEQQ